MRILILTLLIMGSCGSACAEVVINMEAIKQIESSGNPGAFNKHSKARGWFQITPICLKDFNQLNNEDYGPEELFDPQINGRVAEWYMNERIPQLLLHYGHEDSVTNRLIAFNAGFRLVGKRLPEETRNYLRKYENVCNRLNGGKNG